jgi:methionyl-tRNA formyltransferase
VVHFYSATLVRIYSALDTKNMGYIDFAWSYEEIDRFVRGLSYFPFENNFSYAKLRNSSGEVILNRISRIGNTSYNSEPGTIFKANKNEFQIACSDSIIELDDLLTSSLTPLTKLEAIDILKLKEGSLLKTII